MLRMLLCIYFLGISMLSNHESKFDEYQQTVLASYEGGEFISDSPSDINDCGDSFLKFLLCELSASEGCDSYSCAVNRLDTVIRQLEEVRSAFELKL